MATSRRVQLEDLIGRVQTYKTAMLTTVSKDGTIHSRPMMTQAREPDMDLWFVTSLNTEKIEEIRQNPKVGVLFYRDSDNAYVSISGLAHIEQNRDLIKRKWKDEWSAWFPGGPEQEDLALIAIDAHEAEYWEPKAGKLTVTFEAPRGALTGEHPELK